MTFIKFRFETDRTQLRKYRIERCGHNGDGNGRIRNGNESVSFLRLYIFWTSVSFDSFAKVKFPGNSRRTDNRRKNRSTSTALRVTFLKNGFILKNEIVHNCIWNDIINFKSNNNDNVASSYGERCINRSPIFSNGTAATTNTNTLCSRSVICDWRNDERKPYHRDMEDRTSDICCGLLFFVCFPRQAEENDGTQIYHSRAVSSAV